MIANKKSIVVFCLLLVASFLNAQSKTSPLVSKGDKSYAQLQYSSAVQYYKQAIVSKRANLTADQKESVSAKIADCYWLMRNYDSAAAWYAKVSSVAQESKAQVQYRRAELLAANGEYPGASSGLNGLSGYESRSAGYKKTDRMKADSADWTIKYLDGINTNYFREFSPLQVDAGLIWATNQPKKFSKNGIMGWDNMGYARMLSVGDTTSLNAIDVPSGRNLIDRKALDPKSPKKLASHYALSDADLLGRVKIPASLIKKVKSIDAMATPIAGIEKYSYNLAHATYNKAAEKVFFSANIQDKKLKNATRTVAVVEARKDGSSLTGGKFILTGKTSYSVMHPAIHPGGTALVFSSNQEGGKGGYDLYYSTLQADSTWSSPSAVQGVNTVGNELFASFAPDGTLYFSSDANAGLGGLDIYKSSFKNGTASKPEHLSYPVNSSYDDFAMTFSADGKSGYFTSDRLGSDDVYKVSYEMKIVIISGDVISSETGKGKPGVKVILYEKDENGNWVKVNESATDADGHYSFKGRPNREYKVEVIDPMDSQTVEFNTDNNFTKKSVQTVTLRDKKPVVLPPPVPDTFRYVIYFDFDRSKITKESEAILDQVIAKLTENYQYKCSMSGHTDQEGTAKYNLKLSSKRAENAKKYVKTYAGFAERVNTAFYGYAQPVIQTKSRKEAKKNRRVEITIAK
jgi:outer membrane protein OmpA-like peptidoglycan-associated protein/tetratricopeptide (TPR) repeat protein